ncbi:MAG: SulP family inorganic anion transporter [Acidobacteria bacterium]|nr:SulP family inorganic anion transporter [Acidobacteriota bacterium]
MSTGVKNRTIAEDALASLVVFLVALPLCMGIAIASGAPPATGLITGIIGGIVVGLISGCPLQVSGPAAGLAVIVYELIQRHGLEKLGLILLAAGLIQIAAGVLKLGQVFRAVAPAVVYGMLAGIGVLIFAAQFHVMVDDAPRKSGILNLLAIPEAAYKGILPMDGSVHHLAAFIGIVTISVLLAWTKFAPKKLKWVPGALVGTITATTVAQVWKMPISYVDLPANLLSGIRTPSLDTLAGLADWSLLLAAVTVAFVASAETLMSATAVDQMHEGPRTDYDRELLAQGVGNTLCGLAGSLPMTGVIVRSATNVAAGAKTRYSAVLHGVWLLALVALAPGVLRLVPTASLAAVLVYTGYKLMNPANVRRLLSYGGIPVVIYAVTVIMIVATDLLTGLLCGLALSLASVVYDLVHLSVKVGTAPGRIDVHLQGAATFIRMPRLVDVLEKLPNDVEAHVHIQNLSYVDHACLDAISTWEKQRNARGTKTVVEWDELMAKYRTRPGARGPESAVAA